jgi:hypothetical protein
MSPKVFGGKIFLLLYLPGLKMKGNGTQEMPEVWRLFNT